MFLFAAVMYCIVQSSCKYHNNHNHDGQCQGLTVLPPLIPLCFNLHDPSVCLIKCAVDLKPQWAKKAEYRLQDHLIREELAGCLTHLDVVLTYGRHILLYLFIYCLLIIFFFLLQPNEAMIFQWGYFRWQNNNIQQTNTFLWLHQYSSRQPLSKMQLFNPNFRWFLKAIHLHNVVMW